MPRSRRIARGIALALAALLVAYVVVLRTTSLEQGPIVGIAGVALVAFFYAAVLAAHALPADSCWWLRLIIAAAGLLLASVLAWMTLWLAPYLAGLYLLGRTVSGLLALRRRG